MKVMEAKNVYNKLGFRTQCKLTSLPNRNFIAYAFIEKHFAYTRF